MHGNMKAQPTLAYKALQTTWFSYRNTVTGDAEHLVPARSCSFNIGTKHDSGTTLNCTIHRLQRSSPG